MSNIEDSIEASLALLKEYKNSSKDIQAFVTDLDIYKSELDTVTHSLQNINEELRPYDIIDYLYTKMKYNLVSLGVVNKLIQQVKECKNEISDPEYLNKAEEIHNFLIKESYNFISQILNKSIDLLYMNDDFVIFTNLMESDRQIKQMILWHRSQECLKKKSYYEGDLNVFYRMMIKQECFVWSKLFHKDFSATLVNLTKPKFTLYEKFLFSVLIPLFENGDISVPDIIEKKLSVEDFHKSVETQDYVYDLIIKKCFTEFNGDNERRKNVMEI